MGRSGRDQPKGFFKGIPCTGPAYRPCVSDRIRLPASRVWEARTLFGARRSQKDWSGLRAFYILRSLPLHTWVGFPFLHGSGRSGCETERFGIY